MTDFDDLIEGSPFTSAQIQVASKNYEAQVDLLDQLQAVFDESEITLTEFAENLGLSEEEAEAVLAGAVDLTLTELRYIANALEVVIDYHVRPASRTVESLTAELELADEEDGAARRLLEIIKKHDSWREENEAPLNLDAVEQVMAVRQEFPDNRIPETIKIFPTHTGGLVLQTRTEDQTVLVNFEGDDMVLECFKVNEEDSLYAKLSLSAATALLLQHL
jgi:hypothetical protein